MKIAKTIWTGCLIVMMLSCLSISGWANELSIAADSSQGELSFQRSLAGALAPGLGATSSGQATERGVSGSDSIMGNGTKAGYMLSRGGIVPNSETVTVDGSLKTRNRDYYLDLNNGMLVFVEPVRTMQVIRVNYRYVAGKDGQKQGVSIPAMAFQLNGSTSLAVTYAYNPAAKANDLDQMTYGLNLNSKLGEGSDMQNMMYFSSTRDNGRLSVNPQNGTASKSPTREGSSGSLFVHSSNLQAGRLGIKLDYQDVDAEFTGFTALRQQKAAPEEVLKQLEKEKGLQRMGFQADYDMGSGASAAMGWNRVSDDNGDIVRQSLSVGNEQLKLKANFQEVDSDFKAFKNLSDKDAGKLANQIGTKRSDIQLSYAPGSGLGADLGMLRISDGNGEATKQTINIGNDRIKLSYNTQEVDKEFKRVSALDNAQWGRERGMSRTGIQLSMAPLKDMDPKSAWNALAMNEIEDDSGSMSTRSLNFAGKGFSLTATDSTIDSGFTRLRDLGGADHTQMALSIYQQFDPNAKADKIAKQDLQAMVNEAGMERRNIRGEAQFGEVSAALQMVNVGDETGGIDRKTLSVQGKDYSFTGFLQSIDDTFTRVANLSPIERLNFGNEYGMERMNLSGNYTLKPGMQLSSYFAKVSDDDAGVTKYGLAVKMPKLSISANYQSIDPEFDRVMDLADTDRKRMALEQGMDRYDVSLSYQATKAISINSYLYDAQHSVDDRFRRQMTHSIAVNPERGPKLSLYRDEFSYGSDEAAYGYLHEKYTLAHQLGMVSFNMLYDSRTTSTPSVDELTVETRVVHLETDKKQPTSFVGDWREVTQSDGKFAETLALGVKHQFKNELNMAGSWTSVRTDLGEQVTQDYTVSGKIFGDTTLAARFGEGLLDGKAVGKIRELSLKPAGPSNFGPFKNVNWVFSFGDTEKNGQHVSRAGNIKFESDVLGSKLVYERLEGLTPKNQQGVRPDQKTSTQLFSIASDKEAKKRLNYNMSYKVVEPGNGTSMLVRRYAADYQIDPKTKLAYNYSSLPEGGAANKGALQQMSVETFKLTSSLNSRLQFVGQFQQTHYYKDDSEKQGLSLGIAGKVSSIGSMEASYGYDRASTPEGKASAHTYKLKYDYQMNAEQFLTFSGKYTDWTGERPANVKEDDLLVQVDFKTIWN